ncbi:MAG: hypothetical protein IPK50_03490 [Fibrobacterota bacterium]|nr:MAG: hypothetical protein IPK50_03490 [Fibrobacterota bacterium]
MIASSLALALAVASTGSDAVVDSIDTGKVTATKSLRQPSTVRTPDSASAVRQNWNSSSGLRNCTEHPEECPVSPLPNLRRSKPLAGAAGFRFQEDLIGIQLGVRDSGSASGQWVIGVEGWRDGSESRRDSLHSITTIRALAPRVGREMWYSGPGPLVLVGSAALQASWQWTELEIDTTIRFLRQSGGFYSPGEYSVEKRRKSLKTRRMSVNVLFGLGLRIPSSSGAFALSLGAEAGPGWESMSDQPNDVSYEHLVFVNPAWRIGTDWCF